MRRFSGEPEYRRRLRQKAEERRSNPERRPWVSERWLRPLEVASLWVAAAVAGGIGVAAILSGNEDASKQRDATREAFTAVQRAFVVTTLTQDKRNFTIEIKNSGNTPTRDFEVVSLTPSNGTHLLMDIASRTPQYSDTLTALRAQARTLGPDDPIELFKIRETGGDGIVKHLINHKRGTHRPKRRHLP